MRFTRVFIFLIFYSLSLSVIAQKKPNVIFIYADDLGYGDLGSYGATKISTPILDKLASEGLRFTHAHSTSATCTPSRYALMTGEYPWRKQGTGVLPGDAALIIEPGRTTLPLIFKQAGYNTAIVGKWHLGLGDAVNKNWNEPIKPGPNEIGFDYSFIFPATADRVPTVFIENHEVVGAEPSDPIEVNYKQKIGNEPTGKENPELLKMRNTPNHGHDMTIVNGIGRIGWMKGGTKARWTDEEMPLTFLNKSCEFIRANRDKPFFLFYSLTEPHVPRMPSTVFKGKSGLGFRGDAILQIDWAVGEIMNELKELGIDKNTLVIFTSDNGPVLDDGYEDEAVTKLNGHTPWGPLRGGKYSTFEAGTRVPFIVRWPASVKPGVSDGLISQVDLLASFSSMLGATIKTRDSENMWPAIIGKSKSGRTSLVEQGMGSLAIISGSWKYIEPNNGPAISYLTNIETGNNYAPQLYNLQEDLGERNNLALKYPEKLTELRKELEKVRN
jgi:arylsulfatase A-like enzyme